jgi:hypothetical protein
MAGPLREPLSLDQEHLIRVIFEPFDQTGDSPVWQYYAGGSSGARRFRWNHHDGRARRGRNCRD